QYREGLRDDIGACPNRESDQRHRPPPHGILEDFRWQQPGNRTERHGEGSDESQDREEEQQVSSRMQEKDAYRSQRYGLNREAEQQKFAASRPVDKSRRYKRKDQIDQADQHRGPEGIGNANSGAGENPCRIIHDRVDAAELGHDRDDDGDDERSAMPAREHGLAFDLMVQPAAGQPAWTFG